METRIPRQSDLIAAREYFKNLDSHESSLLANIAVEIGPPEIGEFLEDAMYHKGGTREWSIIETMFCEMTKRKCEEISAQDIFDRLDSYSFRDFYKDLQNAAEEGPVNEEEVLAEIKAIFNTKS